MDTYGNKCGKVVCQQSLHRARKSAFRNVGPPASEGSMTIYGNTCGKVVFQQSLHRPRKSVFRNSGPAALGESSNRSSEILGHLLWEKERRHTVIRAGRFFARIFHRSCNLFQKFLATCFGREGDDITQYVREAFSRTVFSVIVESVFRISGPPALGERGDLRWYGGCRHRGRGGRLFGNCLLIRGAQIRAQNFSAT